MAICWCRLSLLIDSWFLCWSHWTPISSDYSAMEATSSACKKKKKTARVLSSVHTIYTCSVCWNSLCAACFNHDTQFLRTRVFLWFTLTHILMTVIHVQVHVHCMHATGPYSAHALSQARPTMSCIHLVLVTAWWPQMHVTHLLYM